MTTDHLTIRKMTESDYILMAKWLSTREVLEFYGDVNSPFTMEQVQQKYEPRVRGESPVSSFIVELNHVPIGYMQHYKINVIDQQAFGYFENQVMYGIDQFIGNPQLFNKGYGTIMVRHFIDFIHNNTDAESIIVDPEISNPRAIRCYEKCGFSKVKLIHNENNFLMKIHIR